MRMKERRGKNALLNGHTYVTAIYKYGDAMRLMFNLLSLKNKMNYYPLILKRNQVVRKQHLNFLF